MAQSNLRHVEVVDDHDDHDDHDQHHHGLSGLHHSFQSDHETNVSSTLGETISFQNELANQAHAALHSAVQQQHHQQQQQHHDQDDQDEEEEESVTQRQGQTTTTTSHDKSVPAPVSGPYRQAPNSHISNKAQLDILRAAYARNPFPTKPELKELERETGRNWSKIREYFRQRRNKMRGLAEMEGMEEPGRAMSWLQVSYRVAPPSSIVSQLDLYQAYKQRFDPYHKTTPLLGGQELIQLACATFTGCSMARDQDDYVMKGIKERMKENEEGEGEGSGQGGHGSGQEVGRENERETSLEDYVGSLAEPLRASAWLLSNYQSPLNTENPSIPQAELYASYAQRFASLLPIDTVPSDTDIQPQDLSTQQQQAGDKADADELDQYEHDMNQHHHQHQNEENNNSDGDTQRLLTPVELFSLTRMAFGKAELVVSDDGRFVVRGLEKRETAEARARGGTGPNKGDLFPFAPIEPSPSSPSHPLTSLLKRKLALLDETAPPRSGDENWDEPLTEADLELLQGVKRFRGSRLGREVKDACVSQ